MTWTEECTMFVTALAITGKQFTVDELWHMLDTNGKLNAETEPAALGGIMRSMNVNRKAIAAVASWYPSVRHPDRPIRVWIGTGSGVDPASVDEHTILWALQAIEAVGRKRSEQLMASIRAARG